MKKQRILSVLLAVFLLTAAFVSLTIVARADTMEAIPTIIGRISAKAGGATRFESIANNTPVYSIKQSNGYYSNYMKLRDIAYYLDFDVVWSADEPNAMRLYTDRHYLDGWTAPGPATQVQAATYSTMDIYVDDVKVVTDVRPVMIGYNNYFKVRDIAKVMDFWCVFGSDGGQTYVTLDYNYRYADEAALAAGATQSSYAKTVQYQPLVWYDGNIGAVSDTPVTYTLRDAWGNYDYTKLYFGQTDIELNAMAQLMLDRNIIARDASGVIQFNDKNKLNAYYKYPMVQYKTRVGEDGFYIYSQELPRTHSSNFGSNLIVRPLNKSESVFDKQVGVISIEYNTDSWTAKSRTATQKYAASVLAEMDKLSCDAEKIQYLGWATTKKMVYADKKASELTEAEKQKGGVAAGIEIADLPAERDWEAWAKIWADDKVYVGVCDHYCTVFEGLCNAAGYYFVGNNEDASDHVFDLVWIPDEGRWVKVDCSSVDIRGNGYSGAAIPSLYEQERVRDDDGEWRANPTWPKGQRSDVRILDFFYMMEQIKPGGWLSSDVTQNP